MEKILITGADGFIGKNLLQSLPIKKFEIHTLVRKDIQSNNKEIFKHILDLNDYVKISNLVETIQPVYVIHLAGITSINESISNYLDAAKTIYVATVNLAEACRSRVSGFKQFIMAGSSKEYGFYKLKKNNRIRETTPLRPNNPYSIAKVAAEQYMGYLYNSYKFPYTVLRTFTTYGRINDTSFFIERTISNMLDNKTIEINEPEATRDWIYVADTVNGYLKALNNPNAIGEAFNVCYGERYTVLEIAKMIKRLTKSKSEIRLMNGKSLDPKIIVGDNSKIKKLLGWKPRYDMETGLKMIIRAIKLNKINNKKALQN